MDAEGVEPGDVVGEAVGFVEQPGQSTRVLIVASPRRATTVRYRNVSFYGSDRVASMRGAGVADRLGGRIRRYPGQRQALLQITMALEVPMAFSFGLREAGTTVRTELLAGLTTWLAMVYIVAVNPGILATTGMDHGALFVATCLGAGIASIAMGLTPTTRWRWRRAWG